MTCGFQIRCFVFSATLSAYPAASAAFLSLRPLSFPNKNNRYISVRPFFSSDLRLWKPGMHGECAGLAAQLA